MNPSWAARNLTPNSTAAVSESEVEAGVAVAGQIVVTVPTGGGAVVVKVQVVGAMVLPAVSVAAVRVAV